MTHNGHLLWRIDRATGLWCGGGVKEKTCNDHGLCRFVSPMMFSAQTGNAFRMIIPLSAL
jgi:hypothetical protein